MNLKHFQSFTTFAERSKAISEEAKLQEKTNAQREYADFFLKILQEFDVTSPSQLDDDKKKEFYDKIDKGWDKDSGITPAGEKMVEESEVIKIDESIVNEKDVTSDEDFKEYATELLKAKHKDEFNQEEADKTINGLLADKGDKSYGELVGILQNS